MVVARLSEEPMFAEYASNWDPDRLDILDRAEIFLAFQATKNACRARH